MVLSFCLFYQIVAFNIGSMEIITVTILQPNVISFMKILLIIRSLDFLWYILKIVVS